MEFPKYLQPFKLQAENNLRDGNVIEVEFSGATYQILVEDQESSTPGWAFIHLNDRGAIEDAFCSCSQQHNNSGCVHIATAYLKIYAKDEIPLHLRFEKSFWNFLCQEVANKTGSFNDLPKKMKKGYRLSNLLQVEGTTKKGREWLEKHIEKREEETEENSIKFSHLSAEDLAAWRMGNQPKKLQFELSFFADLAKALFLSQEEGTLSQIEFEAQKRELPHEIKTSSADLKVSFELTPEMWPQLIPALSTISSPFKVHGSENPPIKSLHYNEEETTLTVTRKPLKNHTFQTSEEGVSVGQWIWDFNENFYSSVGLKEIDIETVQKDEIGAFLNSNLKEAIATLDNASIHKEWIELKEHLYFDKQASLHVESYAYEKKDLLEKTSRILEGGWLYIHSKGFSRYKPPRFELPEEIIQRAQVPHFITKWRSFLNTYPGFTTHQTTLEAKASFRIDNRRYLTFDSHLHHKGPALEFGPWVYIEQEGFYLKSSPHIGLNLKPEMIIPPEAVASFIKVNQSELEGINGFFSKNCPIESSGIHMTLSKEGEIVMNLIHKPLPEYQETPYLIFDDYAFIPGEGFHKIPLDPRILQRYEFPWTIPTVEQDIFFSYELEGLSSFLIDCDKRLIRPENLKLVVESLEEQEGKHLAEISYESEIGQVDVRKLWDAYKAKRRFIPTEAGLIDLNDVRFAWLHQAGNRIFGKRKKGLLLTSLDLLRLNAFDKLTGSPTGTVKERLKALMDTKVPFPPDITGLKTELRSYQHKGLEWLWQLYHHTLSGLLADDMGLGKTLQAMALVQAIRNIPRKEGEPKKRFVVVSPTSVIYHWQDKLKAFLPDAKVFTFYGLGRNLADFGAEYDILLTSYGIWRREKELLSQIPFEIAIFDEVQMAKNERSKLHASLLAAKTKMSLGLTGTPIENHLRELKSLFDIVLPSYMPAPIEYRQFFMIPIEREGDSARRDLLSRFIRPFVMRRKKEDVLTELPEKTEEIAYCALLPEQMQLYKEVLEQSRAAILSQLSDPGKDVPYLHVFALLAKLKQICDHPAVFAKAPYEYKNSHSGKWELFVELLEEANESGQKVVVFSQYLAQLDIIELYLQEKRIGYASLRGSTVNRGEEVRKFQNDPECKVFVSSLQAGGLGIDLTAASVVIHYDRWWNAARENQATDRVHRIGQSRGVQVFKLVTRGTFEERIHAMITRKGKLMEEVVAADDQEMIKRLDRNEILELLKDVEYKKEDQIEVIEDERL